MTKKISRIILVDDNEIDNFLSRAILSNMEISHEIVDVNNGKEALEFILKNCNSGSKDFKNLIFLDINMPIMNGFQFLEEFIKLEKQESFVIAMVSSSTDENDKTRSFSLNASYYFEKPLVKEKIMLVLNSL